MIVFLIYLVIFIMLFVRLLYWLAIFQQKEYRLDRLQMFVLSKTGIRALLKVFPSGSDFTKTGLKRPVRTIRVYFLGLISIFIAMALAFGIIVYYSPLFLWQLFLIWIAIIFLIPLIIFISNFPTKIIKTFITYIQLWMARKKISQKNPLIIGITGSYGKTTTKQILSQVLAQKFSVFMTPKSHNTRYSVAKSINDRFKNQEVVVLEYATYNRGEIKFLAKWFKPDIAVITGLTYQHLGLFGSLKNIIKSKSELVGAVKRKDLVFCNGEDKGAVEICKAGGVEKCISYSGDKSVVKLKNEKLNNQGFLSFTWRGKKIQTKLIGLHYVSAVRASISVAEQLDLTDFQILEGLRNLRLSNSFIKTYTTKNNTIVIDDGKTTNPSGFKAALDLLKKISKGKKPILITSGVVDLGAMSSQIHEELAQEARAVVSKTLYLGEDGLEEFKKVFGKDLLSKENQVKKFAGKLNEQYVVLVEGKIPKWLNKYLLEKK